jgi:hypothetical protein
MSKIVCVDVDGTLISKDKNPRPYFHLVLDFCVMYNIELVIWSANGQSYVEKIVKELFPHIIGNAEFYGKDDNMPFTPSYVIDDDPVIVRKYGGFCVPYFNPQLHNNFQCVMLTGRVLESILNFVKGKNPKQSPTTPPEDKQEPQKSQDPGADFGMSI